MLTYNQIREKFANNDYEDLYEDLVLEMQMYGYGTIEEMVADDKVNGGCQNIARALCEDFPDRYEA